MTCNITFEPQSEGLRKDPPVEKIAVDNAGF